MRPKLTNVEEQRKLAGELTRDYDEGIPPSLARTARLAELVLAEVEDA